MPDVSQPDRYPVLLAKSEPRPLVALSARLRRLSKKGMRLLFRNLPLLILLLPMQVSFAQTLAANPARQLVYRHARLPFKYLSSSYLALGLSARDRLQAAHHHYAFLNDHVRSNALAKLHDEGVRLWDAVPGDIELAIELGFPLSFDHPGRKEDQEGDLLLVLVAGGRPCFAIGFTVVPLSLAGIGGAAESALFIGRVQGVCRDADLMRRVTRSLGDISPRDLLWSALEGIASALRIDHALGVSNDSHVLNAERDGEGFSFDYDAYWQALGGTRTPQQWDWLPLPVQGKPLAEVPQKHRRRTERKRQAKAAVREAVAESFRREVMQAAWKRTDAAGKGDDQAWPRKGGTSG